MHWLFKKTTDVTEFEYASAYNQLSVSRKAHIDRMKSEKDKKSSLLASILISELQKTQKIEATLQRDQNGRPYLKGSDFYISISHSMDGVICVIHNKNIGIDIEKVRPIKTELINYVCTQEEKDYVFGKDDGTLDFIENKNILKRFFGIWTAKEAYFKKTEDKNYLKINTLALEKESFEIEDFIVTIN